MKKEIILTPLAEIGQGSALLTDTQVLIRTSGISGSLKAWLIGGEAEPIGNIVDGKLQKSIDTTKHSGILITQSGRQMLIGHYGEEVPLPEEEALPEKTPFDAMGFNWQKITEKSFAKANSHLRFILSNKNIYENYKKHRHYYIGESDTGGAIALKYDEEDNPFEFLGEKRLYKNGYAIICVDKKTGKLYLPEKR